jgi:succinoglycan biosynthesis transport protein ExoP
MSFIEQPAGAQAAAPDLLSTVLAVLRHWKLIIAIPLFTVIATYGVLKFVPSSYKSTAAILIFDPQRQIDAAVQKPISPFVDAVNNEAMNTEIEVIKSKSVALRVAKELGLDKDPEFQPHNRFSALAEWLGLSHPNDADASLDAAEDPDKAEAQKLDRAADALLQNLKVERVLLSYILTISVTSPDPAKAQQLAATVAEDYLASQREARQDALQRVASWLKGRVDDFQSRVLETEASIEKLKAESGVTDTKVNDQQIAQLNIQLMGVRSEVAQWRAQLEQARRLTEKNGDVREMISPVSGEKEIPQLVASSAISQLRQQHAELSWREEVLRKNLGERHAEVVATRAQLAGINMRINAEAEHVLGNMKNAYDIAVRREQSLEASLQSLTSSRGNSAASVKVQQLRRVADADRKLYESYLSQFNEISQRRTLQDASARVITPAALPGAPSSPRRLLFYAAAGILGLGSGLSLAFLMEFFQAGVKTGAQVEQAFGYPVVGVIPLVPRRKFRNMAYDRLLRRMVDAPLSQFSEAIHAMRIGLELWSSDPAPKVILITSSVPAEGKSTAAMLLATSSASSGHRAVLIDCDLRRQSTSGVFGNKQQPGLSELLRGTAELMDVISKDPATRTYVIPAGAIVPNPADLLMSQRMQDLIAELRDEFDYIVMDASPLLPVVDALALATVADKILLIVEWNRTPRATISEAFKVLRPEARRIAGIVLSKVDLKQLDGYGYRRSYNYRALEKYFTGVIRINRPPPPARQTRG